MVTAILLLYIIFNVNLACQNYKIKYQKTIFNYIKNILKKIILILYILLNIIMLITLCLVVVKK